MGRSSYWKIAVFVAAWVTALPRAVVPGMDPAGKGFPRATAYGVEIDNNIMSALCVDCHSRSLVFNDNSSMGSHFVHRNFSNPTQKQAEWERTTAWDNTTFSRYGSSYSSNAAQGSPGEMICESCHNLLKNVGPYKLLATDNEATDPSPLCMGCHTAASLTGHHPLTGEPVYTRGGATLSTTGGNVLATPLDNATYPGPDQLNCRSCHRVHRGPTVTGARILKTGVGTGVKGSGITGVERQVDIDPTGVQRLVTDFSPLCSSCHTQ
jgi:hypothetical protein